MALSKKKSITEGAKLVLGVAPAGGGLPPRLVLYIVIIDASGSMKKWLVRQGEFIPAVRSALVERGGPRVAERIYGMTVVVSGDAVFSDFAPLSRADDPPYTPLGETPIGTALGLVAEKLTAFLEQVVFPQNTTVRNLEVLIASDLFPTGEEPAETEAGVAAFIAAMRKFNGKVTVLAPDAEAVNRDLAARLDLNERGVRYLDAADPKAVINITFDSLLQASRKVTGSKPRLRTQ